MSLFLCKILISLHIHVDMSKGLSWPFFLLTAPLMGDAPFCGLPCCQFNDENRPSIAVRPGYISAITLSNRRLKWFVGSIHPLNFAFLTSCFLAHVLQELLSLQVSFQKNGAPDQQCRQILTSNEFLSFRFCICPHTAVSTYHPLQRTWSRRK